jgi:hypothetical protein
MSHVDRSQPCVVCFSSARITPHSAGLQPQQHALTTALQLYVCHACGQGTRAFMLTLALSVDHGMYTGAGPMPHTTSGQRMSQQACPSLKT